MGFNLNEEVITALQDGPRKIRNIEFDFQDCSSLTIQGKKISGTVINAFGAVLQQRTEDGWDSSDWCIFSTWLGDLIRKRAQARVVGSFEDHVRAAVSDVTFSYINKYLYAY